MIRQMHLARPDHQPPASIHRVPRIDAQVENGIFHLMLIDEDAPALGLVLDRNGDLIADRPVDQLHHAPDQSVRVHGAGQQRF